MLPPFSVTFPSMVPPTKLQLWPAVTVTLPMKVPLYVPLQVVPETGAAAVTVGIAINPLRAKEALSHVPAITPRSFTPTGCVLGRTRHNKGRDSAERIAHKADVVIKSAVPPYPTIVPERLMPSAKVCVFPGTLNDVVVAPCCTK